MSESKEPTRRELSEQLAQVHAERDEVQERNRKLEERLERLEAAFVANQESDSQRAAREKRLSEAEAELEALRPGSGAPARPLSGHKPLFVPYRGLVQATQDCAYECYRKGPAPGVAGSQGEVFEVDVPTLWSDDPYVPVKVLGHRDDGTPITERRTDVPIVDARWRARTSDVGVNNVSARAM